MQFPYHFLHSMSPLRNLWRTLKQNHDLMSPVSLMTAFPHPRTRKILPFETIKDRFNPPIHVFYGYLWFCHYAQTITPSLQFSKLAPFEQVILAGPSQKGLISDICKTSNAHSM